MRLSSALSPLKPLPQSRYVDIGLSPSFRRRIKFVFPSRPFGRSTNATSMPSPEYTVASADQTLSGGASIVMRSGAATVVLYVRSSTRIARSVGSGGGADPAPEE